jgi:hypothetical protein
MLLLHVAVLVNEDVEGIARNVTRPSGIPKKTEVLRTIRLHRRQLAIDTWPKLNSYWSGPGKAPAVE